MMMPRRATSRNLAPLHRRQDKLRPRSEVKRARIVEAATQHFAGHGYDAVRVSDIAAELGIAKGSIFQHFGSKDGLFFEVYKQAVGSFTKYLDAPLEVRQQGFFEVLRYRLASTERLIDQNWIPYRIYALGNHGTEEELQREIRRLLENEDLHGTMSFVRFGLDRHEVRDDLDLPMMVSTIDWMVEHFQQTLISNEVNAGGLHRQAESEDRKEARIQQFVAMLHRAIGAPTPNGTEKPRRRAVSRH
jgi:AcrR family transcriptional regulator